MCSFDEALGLSWPCEQRGKLTTLLLGLLIICFSVLPAQAQYEGGNGTAGNPYLIYTVEHLNAIGANPGHWGKHFKLMGDIDMSEHTGAALNIIGTTTLETFSGVFDGNGHTISNLSLTSTSQRYTGLFGYVTGRIENLGLINPNVFAAGESRYVGALAGYLDQGNITGCYAKDARISGGHFVGGLVGWNAGRIVDCCTSGSVSGDVYVGGLVGQVGLGTVTGCYSNASVLGNRDVGGLAGKTLKDTSAITHCYATGDVTGDVYVGGLVGLVERGAVYKCYSVGRVSGNRGVGGLAGERLVLGMISQCFWDTQTSGQPTDAGGTGKTTAEMQIMSTFTSAGWDFWNTWTICPEMNYPVFLWQIPVGDFRCPDGVNFIDFAFFAAHWHQSHCGGANSYCEGTDLDQSGLVDIKDLEIFAEHWLESVTITEGGTR